MIILMKYIFLGANLNAEFATHRNLLVLNAMKCESELAELLTAATDESSAQVDPLPTDAGFIGENRVDENGNSLFVPSSTAAAAGRSMRSVRIVNENNNDNVTAFNNGDIESNKSQSFSAYQQLAINRMGSRFDIAADPPSVSVSVVGVTPLSPQRPEFHILQKQGSQRESARQSASDASTSVSENFQVLSSRAKHPLTVESTDGVTELTNKSDRVIDNTAGAQYALASVHHPDHSIKTRLKIFELEESVKAMRRAVEAIDISNREYAARVGL